MRIIGLKGSYDEEIVLRRDSERKRGFEFFFFHEVMIV